MKLENLMRFSKIEKQKKTIKKLSLKGSFAALYCCHGNRWDIADTRKKLYANRFIQMTKHRSSDRDASVVIFLHWTRTVSRRKTLSSLLTLGTPAKKSYLMPLKRKSCAVQLHPVNLVIDKAMMIKLSMI